MTGGNRQQKYKVCDKINNPKKSIAQYKKSHSNIINCSFSKCKKDFRFIYFMNFLEGKHFILFYSSIKTFFDAIKRYFVPRHIESTLIECLMTVVKVMTRQPLAHHIFCLFTTIRSYLYIKTL